MTRVLFDFATPDAVQAFTPVDDRVMGGISRSRLLHDAAGHAVFEGRVSLDNNGGFASVRSAPLPLGMAGAREVRVDAWGDGRRYWLSLVDGDALDTVNHQIDWLPDPSGWSATRLPLAGFRARWRGRPLPDAAPLDPARIRQVGLLIGDGQAGPFRVLIRSIALA